MGYNLWHEFLLVAFGFSLAYVFNYIKIMLFYWGRNMDIPAGAEKVKFKTYQINFDMMIDIDTVKIFLREVLGEGHIMIPEDKTLQDIGKNPEYWTEVTKDDDSDEDPKQV